MYVFIPPVVFLVLCIGITIFLSRKNLSLFAIAIGAAAISALVFQVVGFVIMGYLDPFFLIAFLISFVLGCVICFITGILVRKIKAK